MARVDFRPVGSSHPPAPKGTVRPDVGVHAGDGTGLRPPALGRFPFDAAFDKRLLSPIQHMPEVRLGVLGPPGIEELGGLDARRVAERRGRRGEGQLLRRGKLDLLPSSTFAMTAGVVSAIW